MESGRRLGGCQATWNLEGDVEGGRRLGSWKVTWRLTGGLEAGMRLVSKLKTIQNTLSGVLAWADHLLFDFYLKGNENCIVWGLGLG